MKRLLLLSSFIASLLAAPDVAEFQQRTINMEKAWGPFIISMLGCKLVNGDLDFKNCDTKQGRIDYSAYFKARKAAKILFDLEEKK